MRTKRFFRIKTSITRFLVSRVSLTVAILSVATLVVAGCTSTNRLPSWMSYTSHEDSQAFLAPWETSFEIASSDAVISGKPMMLWFTGSDWCKYCMMLEKEVFHTPEFVEWYADQVVPVLIDFPRQTSLPAEQEQQNEMLKQKYADLVTSYPTVLFVNSEGQVIGKLGYTKGGPDKWIDQANHVLALTL